MKLAEELSRIVLAIVESQGYLKPAARNDTGLLAIMELAIARRIQQNRNELHGFILWWGERSHVQHDKTAGNYKRAGDWRTCPDPLCLSLMGSATEIENELEPAASANPTRS